MKPFSESKPITNYSLLITAAILIAALFRLYGLNWDQGYHLHPDERMIVMVTEGLALPKPLDPKTLFSPGSPLNPKFFAYGNLPLYFLRAASLVVGQIFGSKWARYDYLNLLGRTFSAIFDLGVIILIFKLGEKIFSRKVAILTSFFYATCVLPIQLSHFYAVDVLLNFFILLTLYCLVLFYEKQTLGRSALVGINFGLALATKVSATILIVSIGVALFFDIYLIFLKRWKVAILPWWRKIFFFIFKSKKKKMAVRIAKSLLGLGLIILLVSILTFLVCQPYALIDFPAFWRQINEQHRMTKDAFVFPYTLQYVETTPYLYHLRNLWFWGMGIGLGALSIFGVNFYFFDLLKRLRARGEEEIEAKEIILFVFLLVYFLLVGRFAVKFMRYLLPLYPLLCLYAAWFIFFLADHRDSFLALAGKVCLVLVGVVNLGWALSFVSIYSRPNTRVLASRWFAQNIPSGAKIAVEHWDDRVPMWGNYQFLEMPMYEPDDSELKWRQVGQNLAEADYLVLASNRLYVPLPKLADCQKYLKCYPKTAQYYQDLFTGKLGFNKIAEFTSYPKFSIFNFQFSIPDDAADESFTVYDHPKVMVFGKSL